ncbi:ovoinhibitor-like, partial [Bombus huntii]|uniref:ovoinhibitor-like n=1 Tax=Bombus huntii TaxID=85661 RepID=UPI0021AAA99E
RFLGFTLICRRGWTFILANKRIFYQNCEIFNNVDLYDGPVCGSDGITYANDLYLDCVNYQTFQNGEYLPSYIRTLMNENSFSVIPMHSGYCLPVDDYCKINLFYRPICGSDGHTYTNLESLSCVNYNRSQNVTVALSGPCKVMDRCYSYRTLSYGSNGVCANNGLTYGNAAQVNCLRQINVDLRILHNGSCTVREVYDIYDSVEKICDIANSRFEWNPVCTSDGVTYHNPFKFLCYKARGKLCYQVFVASILYSYIVYISIRSSNKFVYIYVISLSTLYYILYSLFVKFREIKVEKVNDLRLRGPFLICFSDLKTLVSDNECEKNTQFSCAHLKSSAKTFSAKDEVCGNDGVTYQSIHHLQCHNNQNKYLSLKHSGACVDPDDNPCRSIPEESLRFPVCGSDNLSYVSPEALWCAKLRFPDKSELILLRLYKLQPLKAIMSEISYKFSFNITIP